jgi:hypothetical protein
MECTTAAAHNLAVGQYVEIVMDSDLTASTAFATDSTIGAISGEYRVAAVIQANKFSVVFTPGHASTDDVDDAALDGNVYVHPRAQIDYVKTIPNIALADAESSAACCGDWDGQVKLTNRTEDITVHFIVDAGAVTEAVDFLDVAGAKDYDTDGTDASQGVEIASNALNVYNEDNASNVYDLRLENSPIKSEDVDGYLCFYLSGRNLILKNRLGASITAAIERVA